MVEDETAVVFRLWNFKQKFFATIKRTNMPGLLSSANLNFTLLTIEVTNKLLTQLCDIKQEKQFVSMNSFAVVILLQNFK